MNEIIEQHTFEGRNITVTWRGSPFVPPRHLVRQASGICITDAGLVVLVTKDGESWGLPGGHPENDETIEHAFIREVSEEACATVMDLAYLGCSEVHDAGDPEGFPLSYQTRFWARVHLNVFTPDYEITARQLTMPANMIPTLNWYPSGIVEAILKEALECEHRYLTKFE